MTNALVLAGGGVTGIAWETGVLLGLLEAGTNLVADADLVIGTSAGSTVAAQILSGVPLQQLFAGQVSVAHGEISPRIDLDLLARIFGDMADGGTATDEQRARVGALALDADTVDEPTRRDVIEQRLPSHDWPSMPLMITAIDALTGEFVVWNNDSGVPLVDAVASSCAVPGVWPCVTINGRRYYDGGLRNSANSFLAHGCAEVTIIAPMTGGESSLVNDEINLLRSEGSIVRMVNADLPAIEAMGANSLDPRFRRIAAEHGRRQGLSAGWR